jgi:hypothetical protein
MDTTTLLIIVIVLLVIGGGGGWYRQLLSESLLENANQKKGRERAARASRQAL